MELKFVYSRELDETRNHRRQWRWFHEAALIDDSFLAGIKIRRRQITQTRACMFFLLSAGRACLFAFEESSTRLVPGLPKRKKKGPRHPLSALPAQNPGTARCATLHLPGSIFPGYNHPASATPLRLPALPTVLARLPALPIATRCCPASRPAPLLGGGRAFLPTKAPAAAALGGSLR
jgi:hypothetical protein